MKIKLSICIPTYNRGNFLGAAIESVIKQATDEVEIVISDNASTDNTEELVHEYQTHFPRIRYHKAENNMGADRNFLKVAELASGEYCWLLGSDDALADGAINTVLPMLGRADIFLTDRKNLSFDMNQILEPHQKMLNATNGSIYECEKSKDLSTYFHDATHLGGLFSYISVIIFKKCFWQRQPVEEQLIGSNWIHVAKIFHMMKEGAIINYIGLPLVLNRTNNDSFLASVGYTHRRLIDLDYSRIADIVLFDYPILKNQIVRILAKNYFTFHVILSDKRSALKVDGPIGEARLKEAYLRIFSNQYQYKLKIILLSMCPLWLLNALRLVFKN